MSTSPIAASTAVVTPIALGLINSSEQTQETSTPAIPVSSNSNYESGAHARSSVASAVIENSSLHASAQHLVPMYGNGASTLFGNNSAASTLVMTPPSPYGSEMSPAIMGSENGLMQHPSPWYHTTMRTQHHTYSDMIGTDWSSQVCANSSFAPSNSPLSACAYQMSLPGSYSNPISSMYHGRPTAPSMDYFDTRFNPPYHHTYYNNFFNPSSPNHSYPPLNVATTADVNQLPFGANTLLNSSPDSGLTVSSEGNESPPLALAQHGHENGAMIAVPTNLTSAALINHGRNHSMSNVELDHEDIKPNIGQVIRPPQEATSTTSNSTNAANNGSNHLGMYNWMKKSTNSNSSQSSTG